MKIKLTKIIVMALISLIFSLPSLASDLPLSGKKMLFLIAQKDFQDQEYLIPRQELEKMGVKITVASSASKAIGMHGLSVNPDIMLSSANAKDYDGLAVIGGSGANQFWNDQVAHQLIRSFAKAGKIVAAICISPVTLANAGVLKGKKATVWGDYGDMINKAQGSYVNQSVVRDGNIITGKDPSASKGFAAAIANALKGQ